MSDFSSIRSQAAIQGAYGDAKNLKSPAQVSNGEAKTESFGDMLRQAAETSMNNVRQGDEVATQGLVGKAGIQQVVEATMTMESTVRVSVAVRDKLVEAYQDVMRMPI
ncbi:flagellar hook-basal body complex protein FliE [Cognatishimia activa]|uniref:Flagellar hook-basal body complex protein FliE n=1 Tax=Cognatishimia activa TaxID=1715691 RepID=A0A0P1IQL8_9RHOB|nr:flagellar hook-basal body complex protein FliE [Cognatishimia activa]MEE2945388.1 flagellar hook-basal body complex protein FliE [Pseudomonadota bacterium]CUI96238.1 flagellar hook-basal body protein FliE [Cognatishimia activa]CUK25870.1 flagellar hook-basal body protein FliE [Cognatishimia activa]